MIKVKRYRWGRLGSMGKFVAGIATGASLSFTLVSAAQVARHDGAFWDNLSSQDKTAYVMGYSEAMHSSFSKLSGLKVAARIFHWKGANRILDQIAREFDMSDLPAGRAVAYLDSIYSNPQYRDFDVSNAIELATIRGTDLKSSPSELPPVPSVNSYVKQ
jgi:hypothetical protein